MSSSSIETVLNPRVCWAYRRSQPVIFSIPTATQRARTRGASTLARIWTWCESDHPNTYLQTGQCPKKMSYNWLVEARFLAVSSYLAIVRTPIASRSFWDQDCPGMALNWRRQVCQLWGYLRRNSSATFCFPAKPGLNRLVDQDSESIRFYDFEDGASTAKPSEELYAGRGWRGTWAMCDWESPNRPPDVAPQVIFSVIFIAWFFHNQGDKNMIKTTHAKPHALW